MIGRLTGQVAHVADDHVLLDVNGVGYIIYCSSRTLSNLPASGSVTQIYTEMLVREDLLQLFGFPTIVERDWHRLLTTVQGVGAKVSLGILGTLGVEGVSRSISLADATTIRRAPGVGPKLATRIVNELKNKAPAMMMSVGADLAGQSDKPAASSANAEATAEISNSAATADALSALVNLGYDSAEGAEAVARAAQETPSADAGTLIKAALKALAPKG